MARTKSAKRTKGQSIKSTSLQKLEIDFLEAPARLAAQLDKELISQQKQENKLTKAINKLNAQIKTAETRFMKAKKSGASKKQLNMAKKVLSEVTQAHHELNKQLQETTKTLASLNDRQVKLVALGKHLNHFEKEWAKQAKIAKAKAKSQAKKVKTQKVKKAKAKTTESTVEQQPIVEFIEPTSTLDDVRLDEPTDIAA